MTEGSGLGRVGWGQGLCAADYDNDGKTDLFAAAYGGSALYRNEGGGRFRDVTVSAGVGTAGTRWGTGCSWLDYDLDGRLDLIVTSYLEFDRTKVPSPAPPGTASGKGSP